jgi:hypothetical protein
MKGGFAMEIVISPAKVYDLGTVEGREEFFASNPWMKEHEWFNCLNCSESAPAKPKAQ